MPKSEPLPFDQQTVDAIKMAQKSVGDRYTRGLIDFFGMPTQPPSGPSPFQEQAADRVTRLYRQAGPNMNMELDERYRRNILGPQVTSPASAAAFFSPPMQHINKAIGISEKAAARRVAADNKGGE